MNTFTATEARKHFFKIIKDIINNHEPLCVRHKEGNVVLLSADDYEKLQETLHSLSIPGFITEGYPEKRARRASEKEYFDILSRVPDVEPDENDKF